MTTPEIWRRLPLDRGTGDRHVVRSDALSRLVAGPTTWWRWTDEPVIILGAGQTSDDIDVDACRAAEISVTKRQSGGATVYADPDLLGLDVALPPNHRLIQADVVESYRWLGEVWLEALKSLGVSGHLVGVPEARARARAPLPVDSILRIACFGSISPYEVLVDGRKLVGLSQVRRGRRALLQSGLYLRFAANSLTDLVRVPDRALAARMLDDVSIGLDVAAGRYIARTDVIHAFSTVLTDRLGIVETDGDWSAEELEYVAAHMATI